ncbi:FMN-binding negative transcriptional regulator [Streptomyces sp. H27-D2]|uniref:FMN-binding negative transcriptional regulator n=1 Tax=Streptomyces sp. H27-D2 TaxID=3046304 RepID=UPI002DB7B1EC|nr:FMN-binding negative transcriptional regulator [Streptomyces sp. H27-D2]MEC4019853.1 FMN-binding negative transcriptional regulator [Streptomyces sp. H27-D2]
MLIHPWDAARNDAEWQNWLAVHDFGQLTANGLPGEPPAVQPLHFAYDAGSGDISTHLARPNPIWPAVEADPVVLLSVVDDYAFIPAGWQAADGVPPEQGVPTSYYAAVQLTCVAHLVDDPAQKAALLRRQLGHFQPEGGYAHVAPGEEPYGRMLPGIRGLRLEVTAVRAKFKYGSHKPESLQERTSERLAERAGPHDADARAHQLRRLAATRKTECGAG